MRLFVAVAPAAAAAADLRRFADSLAVGRAAAVDGQPVRWVSPGRWHLTLAFLGDLPTGRVAEAAGALDTAAAAWRRWTPVPLRLRLAGGGTFGAGRSTVLWAGVGGEVEALRHLARQLRTALRAARLPYDARPFRPHLTLARPGAHLAVDADVAALAGYAGPPWTATEVDLVHSATGPRPRHRRVATADLTVGA
ncbi:RNA 2',3'-cyclic phosphodiesterase [Pilimelia terevasa]|uniref:RNA 2',3'-cyclic phosphodiesterase n=1 Tax=Pilimelia terevasa TaxID=53372 RepID=UPI00166340E1